MLQTFLKDNYEYIQTMLSYDKNSKEYKRMFEKLRACAGRLAIKELKASRDGDEAYPYKQMFYRHFISLCVSIILSFLIVIILYVVCEYSKILESEIGFPIFFIGCCVGIVAAIAAEFVFAIKASNVVAAFIENTVKKIK